MRISDWSSDVCSSDLLSHRIGDEQAADIGAVSQPDFSGPQRLWRSGRRPRVFRQGRGRPQTPRNGLSRHIAEGTIQLPPGKAHGPRAGARSEEQTSELQSLMRNSYAVFCLNKKKTN